VPKENINQILELKKGNYTNYITFEMYVETCVLNFWHKVSLCKYVSMKMDTKVECVQIYLHTQQHTLGFTIGW
jgi:hypothetical protein